MGAFSDAEAILCNRVVCAMCCSIDLGLTASLSPIGETTGCVDGGEKGEVSIYKGICTRVKKK